MTNTQPTHEATCPMTAAAIDSGLGIGGDAAPLEIPLTYPSALDAPVEWAQLREKCPVARVHSVTGADGVMLTRYDDVRAMLADPRFIRQDQPEHNETEQVTDEIKAAGTMPTSIAVGAGHLRWRRLMSKTFTIKRGKSLQPRIEQIADDLIDQMLEHGGPTNLKTALGFPLPVYVICELLGVPAEDRMRFSNWSDHTLNLTHYSDEEVRQARLELWDYIAAHVDEKRANPGDDLLSELAAITDADDGRMSEVELIVSAQSLLVAGHETTANMIGKMVSLLLADRARWDQLLKDPSLVNSAVEEVLRFDANLGSIGLRRYVTEEIEIADTVIEPGTMVVASQSAANRDENVFDDAGDMDLSRSPNPHITFGVGPHSCLGQSLARVELQVVLSALLRRVPTLDLAVPAGDLRRREGFLVGGLEEVPIRW